MKSSSSKRPRRSVTTSSPTSTVCRGSSWNVAAVVADAVLAAEPCARILNHPARAMERYALLVALHKAGINDFTATRLEAGERPDQYPVFIRAEDGYAGPETDLLHDDAAFDAAIAGLAVRGLPRRGRIAIGFANQPGADGYYHKYGAFNIGGTIVAHDRMYGRHWVVKMRFENQPSIVSYEEAYAELEAGIAQELDFIRRNPHEEALLRAFRIAGIDYGRADFGVVDGRIQIYEINTNPHLTAKSMPDGRVERLALVQQRTIAALKAVDAVPAGEARSGSRFRDPVPTTSICPEDGCRSACFGNSQTGSGRVDGTSRPIASAFGPTQKVRHSRPATMMFALWFRAIVTADLASTG